MADSAFRNFFFLFFRKFKLRRFIEHVIKTFIGTISIRRLYKTESFLIYEVRVIPNLFRASSLNFVSLKISGCGYQNVRH